MVGWWGWEKNLAGLPQEFDFCDASQTQKVILLIALILQMWIVDCILLSINRFAAKCTYFCIMAELSQYAVN